VARADSGAKSSSPVECLQRVARSAATGSERYREVVEAAVEIVGSDAASVQVFDHDQGGLRLAGWRGFDPASAAFWGLVVPESASTCGLALAAGTRVVVPDVEAAATLAGSDDLHEYRRSGLRAVQSTPLVTSEGRVVGMLSTHWQRPHEVRAEELRLIDVLARLVRARRAELLDWAEKSDIARRQYHRKMVNRHLVTSVERLGTEFREITGPMTLFCACGRNACRELIVVPISAYEQLRESPHQFVVAKGHATEADDVLAGSDGYDIVAIKPEYRDPTPPTADL
jgi:hypothetical protein